LTPCPAGFQNGYTRTKLPSTSEHCNWPTELYLSYHKGGGGNASIRKNHNTGVEGEGKEGVVSSGQKQNRRLWKSNLSPYF